MIGSSREVDSDNVPTEDELECRKMVRSVIDEVPESAQDLCNLEGVDLFYLNSYGTDYDYICTGMFKPLMNRGEFINKIKERIGSKEKPKEKDVYSVVSNFFAFDQ
ncbi:hypothetical protein HK096_009115 [Nowakowskiella sp. JEL0078]|nr:hypothetical protein HK096_009115 [Nowakowskiella sp. JEL0078]